MKYENAQNVLPEDVIELIQEYADGQYLYIPRKQENKKAWGESSGTRVSLRRRNKEILSKYKQGESIKELTNQYYLTEQSIRRIIRNEKEIV